MKRPTTQKTSTTAVVSGVSALTPTDLKYKTASQLGIPPFNWVPPEIPPLAITSSQRTFPEDPSDIGLACIQLASGGFEGGPDEDHIPNKDAHLTKIPHPPSNYDHPVPLPPNETELKKLHLKDVEAYRRLETGFGWIVCRTYALLAAINDAVKNYNAANNATKVAYTDARQAYIEFLQNLDNHDPHGPELDPPKGFGYGRNLRWTFIDPIIEKANSQNLITGVTIVGEWNPHSSSNGIPIPHG